ncbi:MAG TPA: energy transducer TonB [Candidatus Limnocylindrales bacterium]|nr:energy transducer TonB [Candidatus Limnocylindrales bacterium]
MGLPFSAIRCPREATIDDPMAFTVEAHRSRFLIEHAEPAYPPAAIAQEIEGTVTLDVRVDADGGIECVTVRSGNPILAEVAVAAVRQWKYEGLKINGSPVAVVTDVEMTFTLPGTVRST